MKNDRISCLERKRTLLEKQVSLEKKKMADKVKKIETRKKMIVGSMILSFAKDDPEIKIRLMRQLDHLLTNNFERKVFGLGPVSE